MTDNVFDEYGNYKYPSDVELAKPNMATSMPCDDVLDKIRAEVADAFIKHGLGNTEICFDILKIIDRKGERE